MIEKIEKEINRDELDNKERVVLACYFGVKHKKYSGEEIAKVLKVSRERIRQILQKAIKKVGI